MAVIMSKQIVLPNRMKFINYLQATGTQYINTGFIASNNTKAIVTYQSDASSGALLAADASWQSNGFGIWVHAAEFGNATTTFATSESKKTTTLDKGTLQFDGTTSTTLSGGTFTTPSPLTIFALNRNGSVQEFVSGKIYSVQIYDNGTLTRDYAPCIDSDGVACFYDKVNAEYYYNAGSGEFGAG